MCGTVDEGAMLRSSEPQAVGKPERQEWRSEDMCTPQSSTKCCHCEYGRTDIGIEIF
jgi:hypothetical protein